MTNKINRVESLVDSIMVLNEYYKPDSLAYTLRNPLLLKSYSAPGRHNINESGLRVFDSLIGGIKAAHWDIEKKLSGTSNTGLQQTDKLKNLLAVYGINQEGQINSIVFFLRKALSDPSINSLTVLSYFKE